MVSSYIAVICLFAVAAQADLPARELSSKLVLDDAHKQDVFDGLNYNRDDCINTADLDNLYYHKETEWAKKKFMDMIDTKTKDGKVDTEELYAFVSQKSVTLAVWECTYVHSESLRETCLADQTLTYILYIMDKASIDSFYNSIESPTDDNKVIDCKEVAELAKLNPQFTPEQQVLFFQELAGEKKEISKKDFEDYVTQERLHDDFRVCLKEMKGCNGQYDNDCLKKRLIEYVLDSLTEMDIGATFISFDVNSDNVIVESELVEHGICSAEVAARFIHVMDKTGDDKVSYGEIRTFMTSHTVQLHLERDCAKKETTQEAEIKCYKKTLNDFAEQNHKDVLVALLSLDMCFVFEFLDTSDNGLIEIQKDLVKGRKWDEALGTKLVNEMDGPDDDKAVSLKEYNEFMYEPNVRYALADVLSVMRGEGRLAKYEEEMKDFVTVLLEKTKVEAFFAHLDTDGSHKITKKDFDTLNLEGPKAENLLKEMGMGDMEVTLYEFKWYNRQQDLNKMFSGCDKSPAALYPILIDYCENYMTQRDTHELFFSLVKDNKNWEIECTDFGAPQEQVKRLLDYIDINGDKKVNFMEFWLWLWTPIGNPKKAHLDKSCAKIKITQEDEIACYKTEIFNIKCSK